jgi:MscS family membrane protein
MQQIQQALDTLMSNRNTGYLIALVVLVFFLSLSRAVTTLLLRISDRIAEKSGHPFGSALTDAVRKPLRLLIDVAGVYAALTFLPALAARPLIWPALLRLFRSLVIILVAWGFIRLESPDRLSIFLSLSKKFDPESNGVFFSFLSKALRFVTFALAVLIVAQEWNFSISGLLAGLGLGGLAFALAAKDMLSNIFAGIVILLDRPFKIGDWIQTGAVEGSVEDINFRSVKIRSAGQALVTVPNSSVVDSPITNYSRIGKRRVSFTIGVPAHTSADRLRACTEKISAVLATDPDIEDGSSVAAVEGISGGAIRLMILYYTVTADYNDFLKVREKVYYRLMEILTEAGIELSSAV